MTARWRSFPDVVEEAARELEPHRIVFHLIELAGAFHRFYNRHRVIGAEPERRAAPASTSPGPCSACCRPASACWACDAPEAM